MTARLDEVLEALEHCQSCGRLLVEPSVEWDGETCRTTLTLVVVPTEPNDSLRTRALYDEVRYVCDLAQMRMLCERFDIKPEQLEPLLIRKDK